MTVMAKLVGIFLAFATISRAQNATYPAVDGFQPFQYGYTIGSYPQDFQVIGPPLEAVHESQQPPTGLAVDNSKNIYLTYPRNTGQTPSNVVIATGFTEEEPWPSAEIQNCTNGQNASTCFINVQNVVLDSIGQLWVVDSGIPYTDPGGTALPYGAKIMSFNQTTRSLIKTYPIDPALYHDGFNANDLRINNTLGPGGFAFITDESEWGSILAIDLDSGAASRRLFNTSVVRADPGYVGVYNGQVIYQWKNKTNKAFLDIGADGIALQSGNFYWSVLGSRRFYYIPQSLMANFSATDEEIMAGVVFPGQCASEQAGLTADDRGRLYITASEHNAIFYVDTLQSEVNETVNGVPPGGDGPVPPDNYIVKTLARNALIQHADSAAILDGYMYFCTNQLMLRPAGQYGNVDNRKGPFRSYRMWIGRGPAV